VNRFEPVLVGMYKTNINANSVKLFEMSQKIKRFFVQKIDFRPIVSYLT